MFCRLLFPEFGLSLEQMLGQSLQHPLDTKGGRADPPGGFS